MHILITGPVGSGKSTIANEIKTKIPSFKFLVISDTEFSKKNNLGYFDKESKEYVVDVSQFSKKVLEILKTKKNVIFEGHLFSEIPKLILKKMNFIFVLKTSEKNLRKRMNERGYDFLKIEENIFCSNTDYFENKLQSKNIDFISLKVTDNLKLNYKKIYKYLKIKK